MAFPTGWNRRVAITVPAAQVGSGGVTNFDVALTAACLPDEMRSPTDSNRAQSDGGDIRFSSDSAGSTQLACDIIRWEYDTSDGADDADILIRVQVASLSSAGDTTIYAWYNTAGTDTQPAAGDPYGQHATYDSSIKGYWPLEEDPSGTPPQILDRTGNNYDLVAAGTMTTGDLVASVLSSGLQFDGSDDRGGTSGISVSGNMTFETWHRIDNTSQTGNRWIMGKDVSSQMRRNGTTLQFYVHDGSFRGPAEATLTNSVWQYIVATHDGTTLRTYVNASAGGTAAFSGTATNAGTAWSIGAASDGTQTNGCSMDEVRLVVGTAHNQAYVTTRYNNENAPGTFAAPGTPADASGGGGGSSALNGLLLGVG